AYEGAGRAPGPRPARPGARAGYHRGVAGPRGSRADAASALRHGPARRADGSATPLRYSPPWGGRPLAAPNSAGRASSTPASVARLQTAFKARLPFRTHLILFPYAYLPSCAESDPALWLDCGGAQLERQAKSPAAAEGAPGPHCG
nr:hypothetical protein [Tanacetum cinerariifolium]